MKYALLLLAIVSVILFLPEKQVRLGQSREENTVTITNDTATTTTRDKVSTTTPTTTRTKLDDTIRNLPVHEKSDKKSEGIVKVPRTRETATSSGKEFEIEIVNIERIDGGVAVFARAWTPDGKQIGFGQDGTVDIERFLIYNPPILVDDPNGDIVRTWTNERTGLVETRTLREDPKAAILQTLVHTISVKKELFTDGKIEPGKVGRTTSTFYPNANPESTSVDGRIKQGGSWLDTWTNTRNSATAASISDSAASAEIASTFAYISSGVWNELVRSVYLFDTSALGDSDTVSSATFSIYVTSKADPHNEISFGVGTSSPTSNTALTTSDWAIGTKFGTLALATDKTYAGISTSAYNDFALNASGLAVISLTGVSKFSVMMVQDRDNSSPTWASGTYKHITGYFADQTGTANDPKLVVEHTSPGGGTTLPPTLIRFE